MSLFSQIPEEGTLRKARTAPLAERMRPRTLEEYVGQEQLLGPGMPLRMEIERAGSGQDHSGQDHHRGHASQLH
jgi:putative ATPase